MKKIRVGILCCCLLSMISSCALKEIPEEEKTKLKVAVFDGAYEAYYWKEIVKLFEEEHKDVKVQLDVNANIGEVLMSRIGSKNLPDVVYLGSSNDSGFTQQMIKNHLIAPLDDVMDESVETMFIGNLLHSKSLRPYDDGKLYLAPLYYNVTGLWYNETLFASHGYEVPKTWDEFFSLGDQAKADGISLFIYQGMNPTYLEAMLWPMLAEKIGVEGLNKIFSYEEDAFLQEGIGEVLEIFERIAQAGYMSEDSIATTYKDAQKRFVAGEALFLPCGNWLEKEMRNEIQPEDKFTFMKVPSFEESAPSYAQVMVEQIYVPKDGKQVALGKAFVAFQFQKENVAMNEQISGGIVPVKKEDFDLKKNQPFLIFEDGVLPITSDFTPNSSQDMENIVFEQLAQLMAKSASVDEVISYLNEVSNGIK